LKKFIHSLVSDLEKPLVAETERPEPASAESKINVVSQTPNLDACWGFVRAEENVFFQSLPTPDEIIALVDEHGVDYSDGILYLSGQLDTFITEAVRVGEITAGGAAAREFEKACHMAQVWAGLFSELNSNWRSLLREMEGKVHPSLEALELDLDFFSPHFAALKIKKAELGVKNFLDSSVLAERLEKLRTQNFTLMGENEESIKQNIIDDFRRGVNQQIFEDLVAEKNPHALSFIQLVRDHELPFGQ